MNFLNPMQGAITVNGQTLRPGFLAPNPGAVGRAISLPGAGAMAPVSRAELAEALGKSEADLRRMQESGASLERTEIVGDLDQVMAQLGVNLNGLQRVLAAADVPVRENLEGSAVTLVPVETPLRNRLRRVPGSGSAVAWRQLSSLGGGWGTGVGQPGGGTAKQMFYSETGAPVVYDETYVSKSSQYKLLGAYGKITNFAVAAGRTYQDQLGKKRVNTMRNTMLNEEFALTQGDATSTAAPWGDGTNALAFAGLYNLVTTANGTPSAQVQTTVGALTTAHIDGQINAIWNQGGRGLWMLLAAQEVNSLANLAEASGSIIRVQAVSANDVVLGLRVTGYVHPITGDLVDILPSRFATAGTMIFGADEGPEDTGGDGDNSTLVVNVLPQVPLPDERPEGRQEIQGYVVTELARELNAPDVIPHMVSVYETLQMRNAKVYGKSTGVTGA